VEIAPLRALGSGGRASWGFPDRIILLSLLVGSGLALASLMSFSESRRQFRDVSELAFGFVCRPHRRVTLIFALAMGSWRILPAVRAARLNILSRSGKPEASARNVRSRTLRSGVSAFRCFHPPTAARRDAAYEVAFTTSESAASDR